ncbi:hypothetical protein [Mycolicibacterium llatzerense]|nr:hypothetical protein [Mycolicibacterium llatzerense]
MGYTIACDVDQEIIGERQWARRSRSATGTDAPPLRPIRAGRVPQW